LYPSLARPTLLFTAYCLPPAAHQVVPREAPGAAGACLSRTFIYHYSASGSWGPVSSRVVQRHVLSFGAQGSSLLLEVFQTLPDLPAGEK
jgi:hypothetical protein